MTSSIGANEIVSSREFEAPRELLFQAWTNPDLLARWWGPKGFTNTFHEFDMKPGGTWRFVMHGPDGVDYPNDRIRRNSSKPRRTALKAMNRISTG